jgi:hypothetical protein
MTITLEDATRPRDPSSSHAFPEVKGEAKLMAARTLAEELLARFLSGGAVSETSFELGSPGGYARTVTGTIAYLDEQGETFMVRATDGDLIRVPLRDVTSAQVHASRERDELRSERDTDGLGTGPVRVVDRISRTARI